MFGVGAASGWIGVLRAAGAGGADALRASSRYQTLIPTVVNIMRTRTTTRLDRRGR
jgi:hypothetical protein